MPLSGSPLNEPGDSSKALLRTILETKAEEIALVYAEGGHTWRDLDHASERLTANG
jgi:hypothetical protein